MKFIDEAQIIAQAGNGGKGSVSFRREKYVPRGGPDGGDGGHGGNVIFQSSLSKRTLQDFHYNKVYRASHGNKGGANQCSGRHGEDLILEVPTGTIVINDETGQIVKDFTESGEQYIAAKGGRGGHGNKFFATATHRAPHFAQPGEQGETITFRLELKLLADVGIIGLPNAGKSTLISVISAAHPKIADYPFTTLTPTLGVVDVKGIQPFVVADIPGLIEGAHKGVGLGINFLRHIERTKILLHMIDISSIDPQNPLDAYNTINNELFHYKESVAEKPQIVVLNKIDLTDSKQNADIFEAALPGVEIFRISAVTHEGVSKLKNVLARLF